MTRVKNKRSTNWIMEKGNSIEVCYGRKHTWGDTLEWRPNMNVSATGPLSPEQSQEFVLAYRQALRLLEKKTQEYDAS